MLDASSVMLTAYKGLVVRFCAESGGNQIRIVEATKLGIPASREASETPGFLERQSTATAPATPTNAAIMVQRCAGPDSSKLENSMSAIMASTIVNRTLRCILRAEY